MTVVDCGPPDPIPHSTVHLTGTTFLHLANYKCRPGFEFKAEGGQSNFTDSFLIQQCIANGNWTPETLENTKCQGKDMITRCLHTYTWG